MINGSGTAGGRSRQQSLLIPRHQSRTVNSQSQRRGGERPQHVWPVALSATVRPRIGSAGLDLLRSALTLEIAPVECDGHYPVKHPIHRFETRIVGDSELNTLKCSGWWEQSGYGRQPMHDLILHFTDGQFTGSGTDMVGDFAFQGTLVGDQIHLIKQYIGLHRIDYHGKADGEGLYLGMWSDGLHVGGKWLIRVEALDAPAGIQDLKGGV